MLNNPSPSIIRAANGEATIRRVLGTDDLPRLKQLRDLIVTVVELREKEQELLALVGPVGSAPIDGECLPPAEEDEVRSNPPATLAGESQVNGRTRTRRPMRAPRLGTIRALIYQVLSAKEDLPMRGAAIVQAVAELKGGTVADCARPVATVLRDKFDPHLTRTGYGEYAFVPNNHRVVQA